MKCLVVGIVSLIGNKSVINALITCCQLLCTVATLALGTPLAKQQNWRPLKRSPDGFGFGGHRHHNSHNSGSSSSGFSSGGRSASSGYGAPAPVRASAPASSGYGAPAPQPQRQAASAPQSDYGAAAAPVCRTEYENECTTVNEEQCETVNDQVRPISDIIIHDSVQILRCPCSFA